MHERNIYRNPPDFKKLSEKYENFARFVRISGDGRGHVNFKDPEALRELTYTLLKEDFNLSLDIPLDRLIPTLSLRLNYIHWIEDLLMKINKTSLNTKIAGDEKDPTVWGVDIGCGASCIYPLLGVKMNNWKFIAAELDDLSLSYAANNININNMSDSIFLKKNEKESILVGSLDENQTYDFCMCNPPFFGDREEASGDRSRSDRRPLPSTFSTATENESITEGGEVAFVKKMIDESLQLKGKIRLYTSMLGKKKSLKTLKQYLHKLQIPCVSSTSFEQGKTFRWGICWSFQTDLKDHLSSMSKPITKLNTSPFTFSVEKDKLHNLVEKSASNVDQEAAYVKLVFKEISKLLQELEINFSETSVFDSCGNFEHRLDGEAFKNTWVHQRRQRRISKKMKTKTDDGMEQSEQKGETEHSEQKGERIDNRIIQNFEFRGDTLLNSSSKLRDGKELESGVDTAGEGVLNSMKNEFNELVDTNSKILRECEEEHPQKEEQVGDFDVKHQETITEAVETSGEGGILTNDSKTGRKRTYAQIDSGHETTEKLTSLFKFKLIVRIGKDKSNSDTVIVDISCIEGSRESMHQLFLYLKNKFNGVQILH